LRAWVRRLRERGVRFHLRHRGNGIDRCGNYALDFSAPEAAQKNPADAVVLALGGGSWAKLGSDGRWVALLEKLGVPVEPLRPANCGFDSPWSDHLRERFAGAPLKSVVAFFSDADGQPHRRQGDLVITENGVEVGLIYALAAPLRDAIEAIEATGSVTLHIDLPPGHDLARVIAEVAHPRGSRSLASHLQSRLGIKEVKAALLHECLPREDFLDAHQLATAIKSLPLRLVAPRPIDEAISSAGGVMFEALDSRLMIKRLPGVFCTGEMFCAYTERTTCRVSQFTLIKRDTDLREG
jgi:uncharacterized flavoprotein (TIGR03862 family)